MAVKNIENNICEAIELIVNHAVENAGYDRTVQATIMSCIDPTIGKYKVNYQDAIFEAYSTSTDVTYINGANVYVLIPGNDTSRDKTILGTTKKLGINYANVAEGEEAFEQVGTNCIESNRQYNLCSYRKETLRDIYVKNGVNEINLNKNNVERYLHNSSSVLIGAKFKTDLPVEQQFRGNYGLIFELNFLDNATEKVVTRNYVMDVNQMIGNPYKMKTFTRQYGIFEIDNNNFIDINKIQIFCYDFPNNDNNSHADDIFIKDIELLGTKPLSAEELAAAALTFVTPQGAFFDTNISKLSIQAQVRVKGKVMDNNSQMLDYYWFRENATITPMSEKYNAYGGAGWECLNDYNLVKAAHGTVAPVVEWNPAGYKLDITKDKNLARENKYKCVVVYNNTIVSKEIVITNYTSDFNIEIQSDAGTKFYYDIGTPTLTAVVKNKSGIVQPVGNFTYVWGITDNNGNYSKLETTTDENNEYNAAVAGKSSLEADIKAERAMPAASQSKLDEYDLKINEFNSIMRVEGNKLHKVQINTITKFATYRCSVFLNGSFIGTGSIVLTNSLDAEDAYSLVINNGQQTFKYNEDGVAPTNNSIENPYVIPALTFTIYDNLGNPIADDVARHCDIKWIIPNENTLLSIPSGYGTPTPDLINKTDIYSNLMVIGYEIANKYNVSKKRNNIKLQVTYKGMTLTTETNFTFAKEGEPGTNGTEFLCRIVPNVNGTFNDYPMLIHNKATNGWSLNYQPRQNNYWFKVQLWHNGVDITNGGLVSSGQTTEGKTATISWEIVKNKYTTSVSDINSFSINATTGQCSFGTYNGAASPANILKATVQYDSPLDSSKKMIYTATIPVITSEIVNANYDVKLVNETGFRFATYSADGRTPQYDNSNPFTLKVTQLINGFTEDVTAMTAAARKINYQWYVRGRIYNPTTSSWREEAHLKLVKSTDSMQANPLNMKPIDDYDGECVTVGLECVMTQNGTEVARIHIPVHMLLNKYGNAAINGWDGNHVSIDKNGNGVILAPQVGAGQKEDDNSFTGMLMGKVKEAGRNDDDTGLFGYSKGERTIFLNSKNGSAILGKNNNGRIIIDPINNKAMLYSQNYWKNYNRNGTNVDLPTSYASSNENGAGMLIDLTTPAIKWGNGNFSVDENGHLIAKGGGEIAGWKISDTKLYSAAEVSSGHPKITLDSTTPAVYSNDKSSMTNTRNGFYIGSDGFALGAYNATKGNNPFQVNNEGFLYSRSGTIGGYTINEYNLYSSGASGVGMSSTSGHGWAFWAGADGPDNSGDAPFHVGHDGSMHATKGTIGGWDIGTNKLSGGSMNINSDGSMSGPNWSITAGGYATFSNVYINNSGGSTNMNWGNFKVDTGGNLEASNAKFTGAIRTGSTITGSEITGGKINITTGGYYLKMGYKTDNPEVSGLNVTGGKGINADSVITTSSHVAASYFAVPNHNGITSTTKSFYSRMTIADGKITGAWKRTLDFRGGILTYMSDEEQVYGG